MYFFKGVALHVLECFCLHIYLYTHLRLRTAIISSLTRGGQKVLQQVNMGSQIRQGDN